MKTFYVASSWENFVQTRALANQLQQVGLSWVNGHDWTQNAEPDEDDDAAASRLVEADLKGAVEADLFVLLRRGMVSHGAHAELGARLAAGKTAHVILQSCRPHLFYRHKAVRRYETTEQFMEAAPSLDEVTS